MNKPDYEERSFGRFVYDHRLSIGVISMMLVAVITIGFSRPKTQDELLMWLGLGTGLLALLASVFRIAGHRDVDWPETEKPLEPREDNEWSRQERERRAHHDAVLAATKAGYDYLGKFLALDAAMFALIATFTHMIFASAK